MKPTTLLSIVSTFPSNPPKQRFDSEAKTISELYGPTLNPGTVIHGVKWGPKNKGLFHHKMPMDFRPFRVITPFGIIIEKQTRNNYKKTHKKLSNNKNIHYCYRGSFALPWRRVQGFLGNNNKKTKPSNSNLHPETPRHHPAKHPVTTPRNIPTSARQSTETIRGGLRPRFGVSFPAASRRGFCWFQR